MGNPVATPVKNTFRFALTALASAALIAGASNLAFAGYDDDDDEEIEVPVKMEEKTAGGGLKFPSYHVESGELVAGHIFSDFRSEPGSERILKTLKLASGTREASLKRVPVKDKDGNQVPLTDADGKPIDGQFVTIIDKRMVGQLVAILPAKDPSDPNKLLDRKKPLQGPEARIFSVTAKDGKTENILFNSDPAFGNEFELGLTEKFCSHYEIFPREAIEETNEHAHFAKESVAVDLWEHDSVLVNTNRKLERPAKVEGYGFKRTVDVLDGRNFVVMCAHDTEVMVSLSKKAKDEL